MIYTILLLIGIPLLILFYIYVWKEIKESFKNNK